jgi:hypothetical protein
MESKNSMTFAPGWTQSIDTGGTREREDLSSYISDTFKAINGFRPRWWDMDDMSLEGLRDIAKSLEDEVVVTIKRERAEEAARQAEMAAHHLAVSKAMKPANLTFKPFANLKEMLV